MRTHQQTARRSRPTGLIKFGAVAMALVVLAACSSNGGQGSRGAAPAGGSGGPVTEDKAFYNGKTMTFVVGNAAGSTADALTRAIVPGVEAYLHVNVKVENVSGNTAIGQNQAASGQADGTTVGILNVLTDANNIYGKTNALAFDLTTGIKYVAGTMQGIDLVVACKGSPYKTFDQVVNATGAAKVVNVTTGPANELQRLLVAAYGYKTKFINGYVPDTQLQGCLRGDGDIAADSANLFETSTSDAMAPGITPLLLTSTEPSASASAYLNNLVPTLEQYAAQHAPTTDAGKAALKLATDTFSGLGNVWFMPSGTPDGRALAVTNAIKSAMATPAAIKVFLDQGTPTNFVEPEKVLPFVQNLVSDSNVSLVQQYLKVGS